MGGLRKYISLIFKLSYRLIRRINQYIYTKCCSFISLIKLKGNGVKYGKQFRSLGIPHINVWPGGQIVIGNNVSINNGGYFNIIGRQQPCILIVSDKAKLTVGNNVGISATAIICYNKIEIGNNVKIGGNTVIYDTDFHSLDINYRLNSNLDKVHAKSKPVIICDNVFIGAHTTILKGVRIGENSIIGACSVVTQDVPQNEIWAGNPAKLIRAIK